MQGLWCDYSTLGRGTGTTYYSDYVSVATPQPGESKTAPHQEAVNGLGGIRECVDLADRRTRGQIPDEPAPQADANLVDAGLAPGAPLFGIKSNLVVNGNHIVAVVAHIHGEPREVQALGECVTAYHYFVPCQCQAKSQRICYPLPRFLGNGFCVFTLSTG
jgi:hypothetical protein